VTGGAAADCESRGEPAARAGEGGGALGRAAGGLGPWAVGPRAVGRTVAAGGAMPAADATEAQLAARVGALLDRLATLGAAAAATVSSTAAEPWWPADAAAPADAATDDDVTDEDVVPRLVAAACRYLEAVQPVRLDLAVPQLACYRCHSRGSTPPHPPCQLFTARPIQVLAAAPTVEAAAARCPHAGPLLHRLAGARPLMAYDALRWPVACAVVECAKANRAVPAARLTAAARSWAFKWLNALDALVLLDQPAHPAWAAPWLDAARALAATTLPARACARPLASQPVPPLASERIASETLQAVARALLPLASSTKATPPSPLPPTPPPTLGGDPRHVGFLQLQLLAGALWAYAPARRVLERSLHALVRTQTTGDGPARPSLAAWFVRLAIASPLWRQLPLALQVRYGGERGTSAEEGMAPAHADGLVRHGVTEPSSTLEARPDVVLALVRPLTPRMDRTDAERTLAHAALAQAPLELRWRWGQQAREEQNAAGDDSRLAALADALTASPLVRCGRGGGGRQRRRTLTATRPPSPLFCSPQLAQLLAVSVIAGARRCEPVVAATAPLDWPAVLAFRRWTTALGGGDPAWALPRGARAFARDVATCRDGDYAIVQLAATLQRPASADALTLRPYQLLAVVSQPDAVGLWLQSAARGSLDAVATAAAAVLAYCHFVLTAALPRLPPTRAVLAWLRQGAFWRVRQLHQASH